MCTGNEALGQRPGRTCTGCSLCRQHITIAVDDCDRQCNWLTQVERNHLDPLCFLSTTMLSRVYTSTLSGAAKRALTATDAALPWWSLSAVLPSRWNEHPPRHRPPYNLNVRQTGSHGRILLSDILLEGLLQQWKSCPGVIVVGMAANSHSPKYTQQRRWLTAFCLITHGVTGCSGTRQAFSRDSRRACNRRTMAFKRTSGLARTRGCLAAQSTILPHILPNSRKREVQVTC
jgi:hypothetical protein